MSQIRDKKGHKKGIEIKNPINAKSVQLSELHVFACDFVYISLSESLYVPLLKRQSYAKLSLNLPGQSVKCHIGSLGIKNTLHTQKQGHIYSYIKSYIKLIIFSPGTTIFACKASRNMTINSVNIEVEYKNIKHIHLSVYPPDGRVHVSAPQETTEEQLRMFILSKWIWLVQKKEDATLNSILPSREYVSGEAHYFKGTLYRLRVDTDNPPSVNIEGDYIVVKCKKQNQAEKVLMQWYRNQLKILLRPIMERWVKRLGVSTPTYDVMAMHLRWGSCNPSNQSIRFNLELVKKPLECIEYIVAHEIIYLLENNHTERFYKLMDTHLPCWEKLKKQLNEFPITS